MRAAEREMKVGDVVWDTARRETLARRDATDAVTHIATRENVDGNVVIWMEQVTDEQYRKRMQALRVRWPGASGSNSCTERS